MATAFAENSAKALILAALEQDELQETEKLIYSIRSSCQVFYRAIDITNEEQVASFVKDASSSVGGRIDVLCGNAGVAPPLELIGDSNPGAWWLGLEVNLKGCYLAARYVIPIMQKHQFGRIIFTSSIAAGFVEPRNSSYQISKLAVTRLADCIDVEYRDTNITAFAVHPGRIDTRLLRSIEGGGNDDDATPNSKMPNRPAKLDDVSSLRKMCIFLVSREAEFLGGRWVDGTRSIEDIRSDKDVIVEKDILRAEVSVGWVPGNGRTSLPRTLT